MKRRRKKRNILYPPFASPLHSSPSLVFVCYKDRRCSLSLSLLLFPSLFSLAFVGGSDGRWLRPSRFGWPLLALLFLQGEKALLFLLLVFNRHRVIYIYRCGICVLILQNGVMNCPFPLPWRRHSGDPTCFAPRFWHFRIKERRRRRKQVCEILETKARWGGVGLVYKARFDGDY